MSFLLFSRLGSFEAGFPEAFGGGGHSFRGAGDLSEGASPGSGRKGSEGNSGRCSFLLSVCGGDPVPPILRLSRLRSNCETAYISFKNSCTNWTAIAPSPTAEATRLTEPERTSPAAKTPGRLVSRRKGCRRAVQWGERARAEPV